MRIWAHGSFEFGSSHLRVLRRELGDRELAELGRNIAVDDACDAFAAAPVCTENLIRIV